ncbi:hypothetical protein CJP74_02435 [Psittacicella melopsittaci]|uniref:Dihydrofolate synthase/folylpolyglutamate synthase n=1 Tax=Psittacicella melopsittaci TaxID=2028576 RepID=A0A3A1Y4X9_9GAMM|nr:hypothetical protein [Psittacicella melopsittaci]RIY33303.1 hypothetical protein CJP74_02435 [Psittacicella melopsittaci]
MDKYISHQINRAIQSQSSLTIADLTIIAQLLRVYYYSYNLWQTYEHASPESLQILEAVSQDLPAKYNFLPKNLDTQSLEQALKQVGALPEANFIPQAQPKLPLVITVGGTNGKGTTSLLITSLLSSLQVVTLNSPHLHQYNERTLLNGKPIAYEHYFWALQVLDIILAFYLARSGKQATYYNFSQQNTLLTQLLSYYFAADVFVQEVGIGGVYDTANALDAHLAIITSIGLDHTAWLGKSLTSVAANKIATARLPSGVIFVASQDLLAQQVREHLHFLPLLPLPEEIKPSLIPHSNVQVSLTAYQYLRELNAKPYIPQTIADYDFNLRAPASYFTAISLSRVKQLAKLNASTLAHILARVKLPGRLTFLQAEQKQQFIQGLGLRMPSCSLQIVMDVAHNPQAIEKSLSLLKEKFNQQGKTYYFVAMGKDKDLVTALECFKHEQVYLLPIAHEQRGVTLADYQERLPELPAHVRLEADLKTCLEQIFTQNQHRGQEINLVFMGSFYLLSDICAKTNLSLL